MLPCLGGSVPASATRDEPKRTGGASSPGGSSGGCERRTTPSEDSSTSSWASAAFTWSCVGCLLMAVVTSTTPSMKPPSHKSQRVARARTLYQSPPRRVPGTHVVDVGGSPGDRVGRAVGVVTLVPYSCTGRKGKEGRKDIWTGENILMSYPSAKGVKPKKNAVQSTRFHSWGPHTEIVQNYLHYSPVQNLSHGEAGAPLRNREPRIKFCSELKKLAASPYY